MEREEIIYIVYTLLFLVLVGSILATPILAESQDMESVYNAFGHTCHQKLSRSLCIFNDGEGRWIEDCVPQTGEYIKGLADSRATEVTRDGATGYKMPVCARDIGLYAAMLFGAAVYPLVRELKDKRMLPAIYLVLGILPLALDGGLQLGTILLKAFEVIDFTYESTNAIRFATGIIAGFASSFYAIPVLMNMFGKETPKSR